MIAMLALTTCSSPAVTSEKLDVQSFAKAIGSPGVVVLDVRRPDEFAAGHIAGAQNLSVEAPGFADAIARLDKGATYAVYCHSGRRSAIAVQQMVDSGFKNLEELQGGIQAWVSAGLPTTT